MIQDKELKDLERKAYKAFLSDGLIEIMWGLLFLGFGLADVLQNIGLVRPLNILLIMVPAIIIMVYGKKNITRKRLGVVKFGVPRMNRKKMLRIFTTVATILTFGLVFVVVTDMVPDNFISRWAVDAAVVVILLVIALMMDYFFLFILGALNVACYITADYINQFVGAPLDGLIPFTVCGLPILLYGIYRLKTFMTKYPLLEDDLQENMNNG